MDTKSVAQGRQLEKQHKHENSQHINLKSRKYVFNVQGEYARQGGELTGTRPHPKHNVSCEEEGRSKGDSMMEQL